MENKKRKTKHVYVIKIDNKQYIEAVVDNKTKAREFLIVWAWYERKHFIDNDGNWIGYNEKIETFDDALNFLSYVIKNDYDDFIFELPKINRWKINDLSYDEAFKELEWEQFKIKTKKEKTNGK